MAEKRKFNFDEDDRPDHECYDEEDLDQVLYLRSQKLTPEEFEEALEAMDIRKKPRIWVVSSESDDEGEDHAASQQALSRRSDTPAPSLTDLHARILRCAHDFMATAEGKSLSQQFGYPLVFPSSDTIFLMVELTDHRILCNQLKKTRSDSWSDIAKSIGAISMTKIIDTYRIDKLDRNEISSLQPPGKSIKKITDYTVKERKEIKSFWLEQSSLEVVKSLCLQPRLKYVINAMVEQGGFLREVVSNSSIEDIRKMFMHEARHSVWDDQAAAFVNTLSERLSNQAGYGSGFGKKSVYRTVSNWVTADAAALNINLSELMNLPAELDEFKLTDVYHNRGIPNTREGLEGAVLARWFMGVCPVGSAESILAAVNAQADAEEERQRKLKRLEGVKNADDDRAYHSQAISANPNYYIQFTNLAVDRWSQEIAAAGAVGANGTHEDQDHLRTLVDACKAMLRRVPAKHRRPFLILNERLAAMLKQPGVANAYAVDALANELQWAIAELKFNEETTLGSLFKLSSLPQDHPDLESITKVKGVVLLAIENPHTPLSALLFILNKATREAAVIPGDLSSLPIVRIAAIAKLKEYIDAGVVDPALVQVPLDGTASGASKDKSGKHRPNPSLVHRIDSDVAIARTKAAMKLDFQSNKDRGIQTFSLINSVLGGGKHKLAAALAEAFTEVYGRECKLGVHPDFLHVYQGYKALGFPEFLGPDGQFMFDLDISYTTQFRSADIWIVPRNACADDTKFYAHSKQLLADLDAASQAGGAAAEVKIDLRYVQATSWTRGKYNIPYARSANLTATLMRTQYSDHINAAGLALWVKELTALGVPPENISYHSTGGASQAEVKAAVDRAAG